MADIATEFAKLERAHNGKSIAAYLEPAGSGLAVPARANLSPTHWLTTYCGSRLVHMVDPTKCDALKKWQRKAAVLTHIKAVLNTIAI